MPDVGATQRDSTKFIVFSQFEKMNTRLARQSLPESDAAWMENLQPVGPNNLVPTPAALTALATLTVSISSLFFANIGAVDYLIAFRADGGAAWINLSSGAHMLFAPVGTFAAPDMTVYASQRILIQDPKAGYSTWDGSVFVTGGGVSPNIPVTAGGSGFTSPPAVTIGGGSGSGATATAIVSGGAVVSVVLTAPGTAYKSGDVLTVTFGGPGTGATATANVWPVSLGTTIAVFAGRVWMASGRVLTFTGTAGYDDFDPANAAGATTIADADLSHTITGLRNLNNYLYIFGDSSVRQIGSISVSSNITLFTPLILASDIGTSFLKTILSYNRLVLFANKNGVYAVFGASVEKISDDLDGIFGGSSVGGATHSSIDFSLVPSAALNDIRNIHCYLLLVRYVDPVAGARSIILVFQEKRWFVVSQGNNLVAITSAFTAASQQYETFGSSGADITQLLQDAATAVPITLQTALTSHGNPVQAKQPIRAGVGAVFQGTQTLNFSVDNENFSRSYVLTDGAQVTWINNAGGVVTFDSIIWIGRGYRYPFTGVDGSGKMLGVTITGAVANNIINQVAIEYQDRALWGAAQ